MEISHLNPFGVMAGVARNRYLLVQLIKRDLLLKYRGAFFGVLWVFLNPLILLAVFTLVFGHIFPSRWPTQGAHLPNAVLLFAGLLTFNLFSETVSRAPGAVRSYPSYVKKIIFPLEILPIVPLGSAITHAVFNMVILLAALAWLDALSWQLLWWPVLVLPLLLIALGLAWFLAAWGVYIKDMSQIVPVFMQMMLFLSPVFYPAEAVPGILKPIFQFNPLVPTLENVRAAITGAPISWEGWAWALMLALVACLLGYAFFQHSREEFADVL